MKPPPETLALALDALEMGFTPVPIVEQIKVPALIYALVSARRIRHERHGLRRGAIRIPEDAIEEYRQRCTVEVGVSEQPPGDEDEAETVPVPKRHGPGIDLW